MRFESHLSLLIAIRKVKCRFLAVLSSLYGYLGFKNAYCPI